MNNILKSIGLLFTIVNFNYRIYFRQPATENYITFVAVTFKSQGWEEIDEMKKEKNFGEEIEIEFSGEIIKDIDTFIISAVEEHIKRVKTNPSYSH